MRAAREARSTSSTQSSRVRSLATAPRHLPPAGGLTSPDYARAPAVRRHRDTFLVAPFEHAGKLGLVVRESDGVERIGIVAAKRAHHVAIAASIAGAGTGLGTGRKNRGERVWRLYPRRAQVQLVFARRRRDRKRAQSEALGHPLGDVLILLRIRLLIL